MHLHLQAPLFTGQAAQADNCHNHEFSPRMASFMLWHCLRLLYHFAATHKTFSKQHNVFCVCHYNYSGIVQVSWFVHIYICPFRFSCILQYVQQPLGKPPADFEKILAQAPCSRHILQMDLILGTHRGNGTSKFTSVDGAAVPTAAGAPGSAVAEQPVADSLCSGECLALPGLELTLNPIYLALLQPHLLQCLTEAMLLQGACS